VHVGVAACEEGLDEVARHPLDARVRRWRRKRTKVGTLQSRRRNPSLQLSG
jgi:hypothetical protein